MLVVQKMLGRTYVCYCLSLGSLESRPWKQTWVQVAYLGDGHRKHEEHVPHWPGYPVGNGAQRLWGPFEEPCSICTSEMSSQCWMLERLSTLVPHRLRVFSGTVTASSHPNCASGLPWKKQPWEKSWGKKAERCGRLWGGALAACMVLSTQLKWDQWWAEGHGAEHTKCFTFLWLLDGCILLPATDWTLWQA